MALEEEQLNGRIASIINELAKSSGWVAREELWNALRGPRTKPDILITREDAPPIVIENEYRPASTVYDDCMKSVGRELDPDVAGGVGTVNAVFAVRSPLSLRDCATADEARRMLMDGEPLEYAVYHGDAERCVRFPQDGFISGSVRDFLQFIRPASESEDAVAAAVEALQRGAVEASVTLMRHAENMDFGLRIAQTLRQIWPSPMSAEPKTPEERSQQRANRTARAQTARMCAAIIINALAYQQSLSGYEGIRDLETVQSENYFSRLDKGAVIDEWNNILAVNYWPIFHIARRLILLIPTLIVSEILPRMVNAANSIQEAMRQNDVAGTAFQRLIADRQTLATYYTRPESAVLAAHLAIPDDLDWGSAETLKDYRIADYACGTGGLILAAYQRVRDLHRVRGGDPDAVHAHAMENSLTACDVMPAAVHLTSSLLSSVAPRVRYLGTRCVLYPYGGVRARNADGSPKTDADGAPVFDKDAKGAPIVDIGSLELLNTTSTRLQALIPLSERTAMAAIGTRQRIMVDMPPLSQDLVIMNPPFTTPTNHAADHVDTNNPAFAAFGTSEAEQDAMADKVRRLSRGTVGDGYAGLGSQFAAIADNMVKSGGHIALILPISSMLGGSYDGRTVRSWQKLRRMLAESYGDITVVTVAKPTTWESAFSADTHIAEAIIIARRMRAGESAERTARFVNLLERPPTKIAAQEVARAVRAAIAGLAEVGDSAEITVGADEIGFVSLERVDPLEKWTAVRIASVDLFRAARSMSSGALRLPQRITPIPIPIVKMGEVGNVGPVDRLLISAFSRRRRVDAGSEYPFLWNHDRQRGPKTQDKMLTPPDSSGSIKRGKEEDAARLWARSSHLHINRDFQFNANATAAAFTRMRVGGGRAWPSFQMESVELEKATCVWLNGTLGIIGYWLQSNRTQNGRGGTTVTAIPNIPTLDFSALPPERLAAAVRIFDDLSEKTMLPANESYRDEVRQELDRRLLTEVLGLDDAAVEQLAILRNRWCMEPTVVGGKGTGME